MRVGGGLQARGVLLPPLEDRGADLERLRRVARLLVVALGAAERDDVQAAVEVGGLGLEDVGVEHARGLRALQRLQVGLQPALDERDVVVDVAVQRLEEEHALHAARQALARGQHRAQLQAAAAVRGHDHVARRRSRRQRPAERAERRLHERVGVEVAEGDAVLALVVLRLDADREQGDDPRARVGGREGVDLLLDLVVVDVARVVPAPAQRLADAVEVHEHGDLAGGAALERVRHDRDRAALEPRARARGVRDVLAVRRRALLLGLLLLVARHALQQDPVDAADVAGLGLAGLVVPAARQARDRRRSARRPGRRRWRPRAAGRRAARRPPAGPSAPAAARARRPGCRRRAAGRGCSPAAVASRPARPRRSRPALSARALAPPAVSPPHRTGVPAPLRIFRWASGGGPQARRPTLTGSSSTA